MDAEDRISRLPDELIGCILSFISTKQAASTSVLSKRWRNVFAIVYNLDLDDHEAKRDRHGGETSKRFTAFVSNLLNLQGGSCLKKVTLKSHVGVRGFLDRAHVQNWICNVLDRGVVDLDLVITFLGKILPVFKLNLMSKTLVKLRLGSRFIIKLCDQDVSLPMLRKLCLYSVDFDGDSNVVGTLLSRCPLLEEFDFEELISEEHHPVQIQWSSPSLKRLRVRFNYDRIISFDFPNLAFFELSYELGSKFLDVKLDSLVEARLDHRLYRGELWVTTYGNGIHVDMIHLINAISNVRVLHLSSVFLELLCFYRKELPVFNSLVCLSIESDGSRSWGIMPLLIKNTPNLETLVIKGLKHRSTRTCGDVCFSSGPWRKDRSSFLSASRVKVLEISDYRDSKNDRNQMKHFLAKLPCLELVKICAENKLKVPIDIHRLLTLQRVSPKCKIQVILNQKTSE